MNTNISRIAKCLQAKIQFKWSEIPNFYLPIAKLCSEIMTLYTFHSLHMASHLTEPVHNVYWEELELLSGTLALMCAYKHISRIMCKNN